MLKVNLLPPRVKAARVKQLMMLAVVAVTGVLLTIPAGFWYLRFARVRSLQAEVKRLDAAAGEYAGIIEKVTALETQEAALAKKLEVLDKLIARQASWIHILEALSFSQAQAKDLWLTSFSSKTITAAPDAGKTEITIVGMAFSVASMDDFIRTFQHSDFSPDLEKPPSVQGMGVEGQNVIQFTAVFKFKA